MNFLVIITDIAVIYGMEEYRQTRRTQSQNLNVSRLLLQSSLKPAAKSRMKM